MTANIDPSYYTSSVSIIIVNYNAGAVLTECVSLALKQAKEVIVVDNASTDSSIRMLELSFGTKPHLGIIKNRNNLGFAKACNIGSEVASGDYFLFLNPDCLLQTNAVVNLLESFNVSATVGMVGGLLTNLDGTEQGGGRRAVPTPWRSFVRAFGLTRFSNRWPILFYDFNLHQQPLPEEPIYVEAISGACMMIKREAMEDVGHWDNDYFLHCEDLDLCMRFRQNGWRILFVPNAPVVHHLGLCSNSRRIFVEWHKHKGMIRFYKKFFKYQYPGPLMWLVKLGVWFRFGGIVAYINARRFQKLLRFRSKSKSVSKVSDH